MRTIDEIKREANECQNILDNIPVGHDIADKLVDFLGELSRIYSRTARMYVEVVKMRDDKKKVVISNMLAMKQQMPASIQKEYIQGCLSEDNALVDWVASLHDVAHQQSKNVITQISYEKSMLELTRSGY